MKFRILLLLLVAVFCLSGSAMALNFSGLEVGQNITVYDRILNSGGVSGTAQGLEDNETEMTASRNNTIRAQHWDFEGMFINKGTGTLTIVGGGLVPKSGLNYYANDFRKLGDFFIGSWGDNSSQIGQRFNPGYVFDFARGTDDFLMTGGGSFQVFTNWATGGLEDTTDVTPISDPWRLGDGSSTLLSGNAALQYTLGVIDSGSPFAGWYSDDGHFYLQLSGLTAANLGNVAWNAFMNTDSIYQITWKCGNDVLRGGPPVPEPATMLLLGAGLIGLVGVGRKQLFKKRG